MILQEKQQLFSKSLIWQLQREYFDTTGVEAWSSGQVPHYITSNPIVGKTYAELVLAFLRDLSLKGKTDETVYLLELGAGHGRLCYHFLKHFEKYYEQSGIKLPPFCYVLSDFTKVNLEFWKSHPRLQYYRQNCMLDFALFDVEKSNDITLDVAGVNLSTISKSQPLLVIANYFFDSIPQELFRIRNQQIEHVLVDIRTEKELSNDMHPADKIKAYQLEYDYQLIDDSLYAKEPKLIDLMEGYRKYFKDTHVLFPVTGIRCLEHLSKQFPQGLVLLTADKGDHHLMSMDHKNAPKLSTHGSFSLSVNYHAFKQYCTNVGGLALFPIQQQASLNVGCMLFLPDAQSYTEIRSAYERFVNDFGPDDFFSLKKFIEPHFSTLNYRDIMAITKLSGYDARIFQQMMPQLFNVLQLMTDNEHWTLFQVILRVWDNYYPLKEENDLANHLGDLLYNQSFYKEALIFYEKSIVIYGNKASVLFKIVNCHCVVKNFDKAVPIIATLQNHESHNESLLELIANYRDELNQAKNHIGTN